MKEKPFCTDGDVPGDEVAFLGAPDTSQLPPGPTALVVAHPGHELRVFGWVESTRPLLFILTDGSGHSGVPRLESTTKAVSGTGARPGSIYGRLSDACIYRGLLDHDFGLFIKLSEELAENLAGEKIASVAGDASEGYNTGHEACRLIIDAAVEIAWRRHRHRVANFEFQLVGPPCGPHDLSCDSADRLHINEDAFARKVAAIRAYSELASEVESQLRDVSLDSFRVECLHRVSKNSLHDSRSEEKPYYERYGEQQVAHGFYKDVIRYRDHIKPLENALRERVEREK